MVCGMSACTEGQKTPSTSDCLATDSNVCIGTGTYAFCINGKWQSAFCPNGTSCTNGACVPLPPDTPYVPECSASDMPVCVGPNAVRTCVNGSWATLACLSNQACANGVCQAKPAETQPECTAADLPVCEGTNATRTCYNGVWLPSPCAKGYVCTNGRCESDAPVVNECTVADLPVCEGSNAIRACVNNKWQTSACPSGQTCSAGVCKAAEPKPDCTEADIPVCEGTGAIRTCVNGKWQTSVCPSGQTCSAGACNASAPKPDCTEADIPVCVGTNALKSCVDGKWQNSACPSNQTCSNGKCIASAPTPDCTVADLPACEGSNTVRSCVDGKWNIQQCSASQTCFNGQCITPDLPEILTHGTLADVGKACSVDTFKDSCDGNEMIFCSAKGKIESSDLCDMWLEFSGIDMRCHVINGIAGCVYEESTCTSASETIRCNKGDTPAEIHEGCGKAEDGEFYEFESFSRLCSGDCKDGTGCVELPENEKCDTATFIEKCEGNQIVSCKNGRLIRTACAASEVCNEFPTRGFAKCTAPTPCDTLGESVTCEYKPTANGDETDDYAAVHVCLPAKDGNNYAYLDTYDYCDYRCDPNRGCVAPIKDEGKECNPYTYEERCQNNGAVFCDPFTEMVDVIYCKNGFTCLTEPDLYTNDSGCYDNVESFCNKAGDKKYQCSGSGDYASSTEYVCKKLSDNKLHYVFNDFETCKNGCNDNTGHCK